MSGCFVSMRLWLRLLSGVVVVACCALAAPTVGVADPLMPQSSDTRVSFELQAAYQSPQYADPYPTANEVWSVSGLAGGSYDPTTKVQHNDFVYVSLTRGGSTLATASPGEGGASLTVRGLRVGDTVAVYAKDGVFTVDPSRNFEGFVPVAGPYHLAGTGTYELPPVISDVAGCGSFHPTHTQIRGTPGVGTSFLAFSWGNRASRYFDGPGNVRGESVGGGAFTATSPFAEELDTLSHEYICARDAVAGIRYESEPQGTVQVTEYEPEDSSPELTWLEDGHGNSIIAHSGDVALQGSRLEWVPTFFCGVKQASDCRVSTTVMLPGGKPVVVGRGINLVVHPGHLRRARVIKINQVGMRELRKRVQRYPRGVKLVLVTRLTGAGRKPLLKRMTVRVSRQPN